MRRSRVRSPSAPPSPFPVMRKLLALIGCAWWLAAQAGDAAPVAFDHARIVASPGAQERKLLADAGFTIAAQTNHHEGQGTSSITVEFENGYLELIWVDDATVAWRPVGTDGATVSLVEVLLCAVVAATAAVHAE